MNHLLLKTSFLLLLQFAVLLNGYGQKHTLTDKENLVFKQFTIDEGLCSNEVNDIVEDTKGFIWIATEYGVTKYDGKEFTCYQHSKKNINSLPSNGVKRIKQGIDNKIWMLTDAGLCYYNPANDNFKRVTGFLGKYDQHKRSIELDKHGNIWYNDPLGYVNENGDHPVPISDKEAVIYCDLDSNIYIQYLPTEQTPNSVFVKYAYDKGTHDTLYQSKDQDGISMDSSLRHTYTFVNDSLWVVFNRGNDPELKCFKLGKDSLKMVHTIRPKEIDEKNKGTILDIHYSKIENVLWFGGFNGLMRYKPMKEHKIRRFNHNVKRPFSSLTKEEIISSYVDRRGILWVGLMDGGVCMASPKLLFDPILVKQLGDTSKYLSNHITDVVFDHGNNLWVATKKGLAMLMIIMCLTALIYK